MRIEKTTILFLLPLLSLALACGPESGDDDPSGGAFVVRATVGNEALEARLLSERPLQVGRNLIRYELIEKGSGEAITDAAVTHQPLMHMAGHGGHEAHGHNDHGDEEDHGDDGHGGHGGHGGFSHSTPFVQPTAKEGGYEAAVIFIMASTEHDTWEIALSITRGGETQTLTFETLEVVASETRKDLVAGEERFIVTFSLAGAPKVGLNPFIFTVNEGAAGDFASVEDLTVKVTPEMPTHGHGSHGNVDPTHQGAGEYAGQVNFSMAGHWTVEFEVSRGGTSLGTVVFEVEI